MPGNKKILLLITLVILLSLSFPVSAQGLFLGIKQGTGSGPLGLEAELGISKNIWIFTGGSYQYRTLILNSGIKAYLKEDPRGPYLGAFLGAVFDFFDEPQRGFGLGTVIGYAWQPTSKLKFSLEGGMIFDSGGGRVPSAGLSLGYKIF